MRIRRITGRLRARTAMHVGSGQSDGLTDARLRRDAHGNLIIPGTAIAGAMRSMLTRLAPRLGGGTCLALLPDDVKASRVEEDRGCGCAVCRLFGDVEPSDTEARETWASRLWVFNAHLAQGSRSPQRMVRDGVGIERRTGAAARQAAAKYDMEVLPAGTEFELRMELRGVDSKAGESILAAVLAEWAAGRAYLGGNTARGLGAFDLVDFSCQELDLDQVETLMGFLDADDPWTNTTDIDGWLEENVRGAKSLIVPVTKVQAQSVERWHLRAPNVEDLPIHQGWMTWSLVLKATGPFLTHNPTVAESTGFDHAPLLETLGDWTKPVLPGSSLRGVLRSHAERIARTLATRDAADADDFLKHCPACDPVAQRRADALPLESCDSLLRHDKHVDENQEIPAERLCLACQLFGSTRRGSRLRVEDAPFDPERGEPVYKMLDFLAVDRFTGGGAEHLKFDALALWKPSFRTRVRLVSPQPWELGWLTLVLRDLKDGWLRVGFGAAKGFGAVVIPEGTVTHGRLDEASDGVVEPEAPASVFTTTSWALDDPALVDKQRAWVTAFHRKLADYKSYRVSLPLKEDTYFGRVDAIYRAEV